jgi:hypothetical protein
MAIPIYNPQVAPPHKPSRRGIAGAEARAAGQLAAEVEQIGTTFAGKLFDLANTNQINESMVTARQRWRSFWGELQRDPDYARYGEKFESFYGGLREELEKGFKLPRARRETETALKSLREDWTDAVQKISDERTIEHARSVRLQSLSQAVADLDIERVLGQIRESESAMEFTAPDIAKLKDTAIRETIEGKTRAYARMMGDQGMLWLMSDEAQEKFAVQAGPEERYFLDADRRGSLAEELGNERTNRRKAEEAADWSRKSLVLAFVQGEIQSGRLTSVDQLTDLEYQDKFQQQYGQPMALDDEDRGKIGQILANRAEAAEKDREAYSNDMLKTVDDAIKAGDAATAESYLQALIEGGYAVDRMGRIDPDVLRYQEQLKRIAGGGELTAFDKDANAMRALMRDGNLTKEALAGFLQRHPDKEGRLEHDKMWNEYQEMMRERESRGKTETEELYQADYNTRFWRIFGADNVGVDELVKLEQWLYRNYPRSEFDKKQPGIRETTFVQWRNLISAKIELKQKEASDIRGREKSMGEERIKTYWKPRTQEWEGVTSGRGVKAMAEIQNKRDAMLLEYYQAVKDEKINPVEKAQELINAEAQIDVETQFGAEYKKNPQAIQMEAAAEPLLRQLGLRASAGVPASPGAAAVPPAREGETLTFQGQRYGRVEAGWDREVANARRILTDFAKYAKENNGNLIIIRNKKTGQMDVFDNTTRQRVKIDDAQLWQYAAAQAMVRKYE